MIMRVRSPHSGFYRAIGKVLYTTDNCVCLDFGDGGFLFAKQEVEEVSEQLDNDDTLYFGVIDL